MISPLAEFAHHELRLLFHDAVNQSQDFASQGFKLVRLLSYSFNKHSGAFFSETVEASDAKPIRFKRGRALVRNSVVELPWLTVLMKWGIKGKDEGGF